MHFCLECPYWRIAQSIINSIGQMQQGKEQEQESPGITLQTLSEWHAQLNKLYDIDINLRMKYPTEPMRFYQPEEQMDNILQNLQQSTQQHLPIIIESNILLSILKILNHPNSDINIRCIEFLHEIISEQPSDDHIFEVYYRMAVWLVENGIFESLGQTICKMDEENSVEEYQVSLQILKIMETLLQLWDNAVQFVINHTQILDYLANRIMPNYIVKHKVIDDNKFVGSDVLISILSNSAKAQQKFHQLCGMQILIQSIRPYLSKSPASNDEQEYLSNLFDCLNILLINPSKELTKSRTIYHSMKGNQIMLQFIKAKNEYSIPALKAIANAFTSLEEEETRIIEELIDFGGLKYIFPIVLRQGLKGKDVDEQRAIDENMLQIVYIMVRATSQVYKIRVQSKFTEKRFAKLQKLFELRNEYIQTIGRESFQQISSEDYLTLLKQGLAIVETIDKTLSLLVQCTSTVKQKFISFMKLYGVSFREIEVTLKNIYQFIDNSSQKAVVERLISVNLAILSDLYHK